ncbi:hypothetical protein [Streptomyces virginiae]
MASLPPALLAEARAFAAQHLRTVLDAGALDQAIEDLQRLRRRISTQAFDRLIQDDPIAVSAEVRSSMRAANCLIDHDEVRIPPSHQVAEEYDHAVARHSERVAHHQRERHDTIRPYVADGTPGGKARRRHHVTCDHYEPPNPQASTSNRGSAPRSGVFRTGKTGSRPSRRRAGREAPRP